MKKPNRRRPAPSAPLGTLAARADEAMKQQRFKEAVDLFKLMIMTESDVMGIIDSGAAAGNKR